MGTVGNVGRGFESLIERTRRRQTLEALESGELRWGEFFPAESGFVAREIASPDVDRLLRHFTCFADTFGWEGEWYGYGVTRDAVTALCDTLRVFGPLRHVPGLTRDAGSANPAVYLIDYYHLGVALAGLDGLINENTRAAAVTRRRLFRSLLDEARHDWRRVPILYGDDEEEDEEYENEEEGGRRFSRRVDESAVRFETVPTSLFALTLAYLSGLTPRTVDRQCRFCGGPAGNPEILPRGRPFEFCPEHRKARFRKAVERGKAPLQTDQPPGRTGVGTAFRT